jgi:hypothetical protein
MKNILTFALMAATACLFGACSDDNGDGTADSGTTANTVSQTITVNDFLNSDPVEGVSVCWSLNGGADTCATTDTDGVASGSVEFQAGDLLVLNASKDKFFPFRVEYYLDENTPATVAVTWAMIGDALVDIVVAALGAEADETKGHVTVLLTDGENAIAGATAEMTTGTPGQGPNYSNSDTTNGIFDDGGVTTDAGIVVFNNVEPGEIELTVNVDGKTCTAIAGENTGDNKVGSMIEAGKLTYTSMLCE